MSPTSYQYDVSRKHIVNYKYQQFKPVLKPTNKHRVIFYDICAFASTKNPIHADSIIQQSIITSDRMWSNTDCTLSGWGSRATSSLFNQGTNLCTIAGFLLQNSGVVRLQRGIPAAACAPSQYSSYSYMYLQAGQQCYCKTPSRSTCAHIWVRLQIEILGVSIQGFIFILKYSKKVSSCTSWWIIQQCRVQTYVSMETSQCSMMRNHQIVSAHKTQLV